MRNIVSFCNCGIAALMLGLGAASAQESADVDTMLSELANPETSNWRQLERRIETAWSKSGSASMDLLLQRAQDAMADEEWDTALEHLTALTDHAPDFAEGWHARATVFFHKKLYGPAIDDIGRALALNPNHYNALTGLAVMFEEMGLGPQALEIYRMVQQMHPHRPEIGQALIRLEAAHGGTTL